MNERPGRHPSRVSVNAEHRIASVTPGFTAIAGLEPTQLLDRGPPTVFFSPEMNAQARERFRIESDLRQALEKMQRHRFYQPPLDSHTARISSYESGGTVHE